MSIRASRGFVPHWFMMLMLMGAGIVIIAAIVIPILSRMFARSAMFQYLSAEFILLLLAFGFLIGLIIIAGVIGYVGRRRPDFTPEPVRFVPHWQMMSMLGLALLAILVPLMARLLRP